MHAAKGKDTYQRILLLYLIIYFIWNICFLTDFPYVHSDEPWLSGLSRAMLENKEFSLTEPFFDAFERSPHGIRSIFHLIQALFIQVFGYGILSLRFLSLLFAMGCLYLFFSLSHRIFRSQGIALLSVLLLSFDIHFIYSARFARQEIILLFVLLLSFEWLLKDLHHHSNKRDFKIGLLIGLSIGIHPNSFIVALAVGGAYLLLIFLKVLRAKNLVRLIIVVAIFALFFTALSLSMDENFIENYQSRGDQFGVQRSLGEKIYAVKDFYENIYFGKSVTYYIPNIKLQLWIFSLSVVLSVILFFKNRNSKDTLFLSCLFISLIFIQLGIILIGRYNVTSIIFLFPFLYILTIYNLLYMNKGKKSLLFFLLFITMVNTWYATPSYDNTYDDYLGKLSPYVPKDAKVLSNLNTEYYFDHGQLLDYRNLAYLKDQGMSPEEYITSRGIQYIIYYEEIDYINQVNPVYNGVYGDVSSYYEELQNFLHKKCHRIHGFIDSTYGTNITRLIDERNWKIDIYKVKE